MDHILFEVWRNRARSFLQGAIILAASTIFPAAISASPPNLLKNAGFEESVPNSGGPPSWQPRRDATAQAAISNDAHSGRQSLRIPKSCAVEQTIGQSEAGSYLARCWVKSDSDQRVTLLLQDPTRPWEAYSYSDIPVTKGKWTQIDAFCALDQDGSLSLTVGSLSDEFRPYHGIDSIMTSPILVDDLELVREQPATPQGVSVWDSKNDLAGPLDWSAKSQWSPVEGGGKSFAGSAIFQNRYLAGMVKKETGEIVVYSAQNQTLKPRGSIVPSLAFKVSKCTSLKTEKGFGLEIASEDGKQSYVAWLNPAGLIKIEPRTVLRFAINDCRLRHGILPSFVGSDICYSAAKMPNSSEVKIPSTQWFVGLADGNDSMLVAVWDSEAQGVSMGLRGTGSNRLIDSLSIDTEKGGFALSFIEHPNIWHQEHLQEDWLGEYTTIGWKRPFQARWMARFFVSPGGKPSFHDPYMEYSFPIANTKTRMWGVWFEDWNRYPFYFDGDRTVAHFEKTFAPNGDALIYFLEPAAADLIAPSELVKVALGKEKANALFDLNANKLRKLKYSTPDEFMYDRPVCATTTRLSKIKKEDKPTVGVNLATHLYEFIREIRGRVDQYTAFFADMKSDLETRKSAHPEMQAYVNELEAIVVEAQSKAKSVYVTPLPAVQTKIDSMKVLLKEGGGDGFDCGKLDVRGPAGEQDDLCRRYNRLVLRLMQTAARDCGDSSEKAVLARDIWAKSRLVLREPTRWEPRRTLYFFEP